MSNLTNTYAPLNISFEKGEGVWLYDKKNQKYLDALCGVGVTALGHNHPNITKIISKQASLLLHTSNWYKIENQEKLAKKLAEISSLDKVFFSNSGAEANETAIKLTRLYAQSKNIVNPIVITAKQSFHGRTMATLSATGNEKVQKGFLPLLPEFINIDFDNIKQLEDLTNNKNIVAVMLEPIQGESGVIIPKKNYLNQVREICDTNNWLMILDEVQTGMGRTGKWFAHQHNNIKPDIMTLAKALGNGVPIGACLANEKTASLFYVGSHGSTYGGNPLATASALEVINTIEKENILKNIIEKSDYILNTLKQKLRSIKEVKEIRGCGMMIAVELNSDCSGLLQTFLDNKLLVNITGQNIRILPPYILNKNEADIIIDTIVEVIKKR